MGKTTLLNFLRDTIADLQAGNAGFFVQMRMNSALMIEGSGDSFEKSTPLYAWKSLIQQLFEIRRLNEKAVSKIKDIVASAASAAISAGGTGPEVNNWMDYFPLLNNIFPSLNIPENNTTKRMTMQQRVVQIRSFVKDFIQVRAKQRPLIIALDNLQWVDSATLQLAYEVAKEVQPILFVMTTRPLTDPAPEYQMICTLPGARVCRPAPLSEEETITIFCNRFNIREYPVAEIKQVMKHANGNPLFAEEISSGLVESGLLNVSDGKCTVQKGGKFTIPSTINGVISSRLDRLEPSLQMVLKVG
jgi:predicted ATPase